jgi:hypothetical protein
MILGGLHDRTGAWVKGVRQSYSRWAASSFPLPGGAIPARGGGDGRPSALRGRVAGGARFGQQFGQAHLPGLEVVSASPREHECEWQEMPYVALQLHGLPARNVVRDEMLRHVAPAWASLEEIMPGAKVVEKPLPLACDPHLRLLRPGLVVGDGEPDVAGELLVRNRFRVRCERTGGAHTVNIGSCFRTSSSPRRASAPQRHWRAGCHFRQSQVGRMRAINEATSGRLEPPFRISALVLPATVGRCGPRKPWRRGGRRPTE